MSAQDLYEWLLTIDENVRKECRLFYRTGPDGAAFNVRDIDFGAVETYGFFGKSLPCVVLKTKEES